LKQRHEKFFARTLAVLPNAMASLESSRVTLVFFAVSGLDVLGALDRVIGPQHRHEIVEWVYSLQVPRSDRPEEFRHGFRGGTFFKTPEGEEKAGKGNGLEYADGGHLAMTYAALATLLILGDDLGRVDKVSILEGMRKLQQADGSFIASVEADECDMRFVFCASTICYILDDWSGMDVDKATDFIVKSVNFDGSIAQGPGLESHGGSTYCGLASLALMGRLETALTQKQRRNILRWCVFRLHQGFQGRPNKRDDTCYSFWVSAAIRLLCNDLENDLQGQKAVTASFGKLCAKSHKFVLNTQDSIVGGMAKWPSNATSPDPLHTYMGLSGMALFGDHPDLLPTFAALNVTERAHQSLREIHSQWRCDA